MASVFGSVVLNTHEFDNKSTTNSTFISIVEDQLLRSHEKDSPGTVFDVSIVKKNQIDYDCENTSNGKPRCFYEILVLSQNLPVNLPNLTSAILYKESVVIYNGKLHSDF